MTTSAGRGIPLNTRLLLAAALAGTVTVFGFAPFYLYPLPVVSLALLILMWQRATRRSQAAAIGFSFGLGFFVSGVSWVYVSLHDFGALPAPLAGILTLLFSVILASYPAMVGWTFHALGAHRIPVLLAALPALWTLTEWLRGWLFTGFPWLSLGYAQVPASPLAGYVPILGIYGATFATVLCSGLIVALCRKWQNAQPELNAKGTAVRPSWILVFHPYPLVLAALWIGGYALQQIAWTHRTGEPVSVSLIQGNIAQDLKWRPDKVRSTLATYRGLVTASGARLIVLPETALPLFLNEIPSAYLEDLAAHAHRNGGSILVGVPERSDARNYYNSVISIGDTPMQTYRKSHLVPFGEFVPLKLLFGWFLEIAQIPLLDFARGEDTQLPLAVAGQHVAVNICYEDAFGSEIVRQLPQATLLVNVSNVAWFGRSLAPQQHLQISQARALETGRYMLRATNTGMTAIIDQRGRVLEAAPEFATAVVNGDVPGYTGVTPYVRWGNLPIIALALLLAGGTWILGRRAAATGM